MKHLFRLHVQEIIDFLDSVVIKFDPIVTLVNNQTEYLNLSDYDEYDQLTHPYYRILAGDASLAHTTIYGYLPIEKTEIPLTRDNLNHNPEMADFYQIKANVDALIKRYPIDAFLIKRILNPVKDVLAATTSSNLTLLETVHSDTYLNQYERDDLIFFTKSFLKDFDYRWYINVFEYENLYPIVFWSMMWYLLPLVLLTRRITNVRTNRVHPFHIWEYLNSVGFIGYQGYLSRDQETFLYRNTEYLKYNVGKQFVLGILSDVFLKPIKYSLREKVVVCNTFGRDVFADRQPDILSIRNGKTDYNSNTTIESFLDELNQNKCDLDNSAEHRHDIISEFSSAPANTLNTKFIEMIGGGDIDELMLVLKFVLDSVLYMVSGNKLQFETQVSSPTSKITETFGNVTDVLNLMYYCIYARTGEIPVNTFNKYTVTTALTCDTPPTVERIIYEAGYLFHSDMFIDTDNILNTAPYHTGVIHSATKLSTILGKQFDWLFTLINTLSTTDDTLCYEIRNKAYRSLIPEYLDLTIDQTYQTYAEYFAAYPGAKAMVDEVTDPNNFGQLIYNLFEYICPLAYGFASLARDDTVATVLIHKVKSLFTYLTSYNIHFITPVIDRTDSYKLPKLTNHLYPGLITTHIMSNEWCRNNWDYGLSIGVIDTIIMDVDFNPDVNLDNFESYLTIDIPAVDPNPPDLCHFIEYINAIYIADMGSVIEFDHII